MKRALTICLLFLGLQLVVGSIAAFVVRSAALSGNAAMTVEAVGSLAFYVLMCGVCGFFYNSRCLGCFQRSAPFPYTRQIVLLAAAAFVSLILFANSLQEVIQLPDLLQDVVADMLTNPVQILVLTVVAPVAEEVCFRRCLMQGLQGTRYARHDILLSAALFGLLHVNPAQVLGAFILGLFLSYLYKRTQSLLAVALCHIFNNSLSVALDLAFGPDALHTEGTGLMVCAAVAALSLAATAFLVRRLERAFQA